MKIKPYTQIVFLTTFGLLMSVLVTSCYIQNRNYQTECLGLNSTGYIEIAVSDSKKGSKYKMVNAKRDAIHALLYSGVAAGASCQTQPPMLSKQDERESFNKIKKSFFAPYGDWTAFVRSSTIASSSSESGEGKNKTIYKISISKDQLRKYLEEKQIIKPINNGF